MAKFEKGQSVWICDNNISVKEAVILSAASGLYTIKYVNTSTAIRVKEHRIFASEDEAKACISPQKPVNWGWSS